jgi:NifU-like N terminal domain
LGAAQIHPFSYPEKRELEASHCKAVSVAVLSAIENEAETLMADTIKTGTTLIEEGTLLPESLQCESEPWTSFYKAGGIIRELRKASGKQNKYGSEGDKAHSDNVIDPRRSPAMSTAFRRMTRMGARRARRECGDVMKLQMTIISETEVIKEEEFKTCGCGSAIASSSLANEWVKGKSSRRRWPSRTRISSARLAFPRATLLDATTFSRIGGKATPGG